MSSQPNFRLGRIPTSPYWYIVWTERRVPKRLSTGTKDDREAELILAAFRLEWRAKSARHDSQQIKDAPISQVLAFYYNEHAAKQTSAEQARVAIAHLNRHYIGAVSEITDDTHDSYRKKREALKIGWQTINREWMVLRAAINLYAKKRGLSVTPKVPTIKAEDPGAAPVEPKGRPLTMEELAALFYAAITAKPRNPRAVMLLVLLVGTMCRPDAARDLHLGDQVDFQNNIITLNPPGRKQTKKFRPIVPMGRVLRLALKKALAERGSGHVLRYKGKKTASGKTLFRALVASAGLRGRVTPYSIRHTMGRLLRRRRVSSEQVTLMLGHIPDNTTRTDLIYAPYDPDYCRQAARAIDEVFLELRRFVLARASKSQANVSFLVIPERRKTVLKQWWARQGLNL